MSPTGPRLGTDTASASEQVDVTFAGVGRPDGRIGIRDRLLVLPSVICSHIVADRIADSVPAAVSAPHDHGCAQIGADNDQTARTFLGVGTNPNVAGVLVVGLGCEAIQSDEVAARLAECNVPVRDIAIQTAGGSDRTIDRGIKEAQTLLDGVRERKRSADLGDLTLGVVATDIQDSTIAGADPLVGEAARRVVDAGGRVVVAGIERMIPHVDALSEAATTEVIGDEIRELLEDGARLPSRSRGVRQRASQRSYDEVSGLWGSLRIEEVLEYGGRSTLDSGAAIVDAPSQLAEASTGLVAAGAQLIVHTTAEGIPTGHPVAPVIKVTGDRETFAALPEDIDIDASSTTSDALISRIAAVADGTPSKTERHGLTEFAITRIGPSM